MMKKNTNKEAQIARMQQLADVSGTRMHEQKNSLGTLIDFKRGADKVAYGIVKENHQYFIKKANSQSDPRAEDFAYIGGQENVTEYRYKKLSEADKNRNMLLLTINEALGGKEIVTPTGSKPSLINEGEKPTFEKGVKPDFGKKEDKEEKEGEDHEKKEDKDHEEKEDKEEKKEDKEEEKDEKKDDVDEGIADDLAGGEEKLASAEKLTAAEPDAEVAVAEPVAEPEAETGLEGGLDVDSIDLGAEAGAEVGADAGAEAGAEMGAEAGAEAGLEGDPEAGPEAGTEDGGEFGEVPDGAKLFQDTEEKRVIDSEIGKLANKMEKESYTEDEVESAVGRLLDPFKKEIAKMGHDVKMDLADENIMKVMPKGEEGEESPEDQLQQTDIEGQELANMEEPAMAEEKSCQECGFAKFAESRGYTAESLMECGIDEMASLQNGYAMENEEIGDEDLESMAVFHSDELAECLKEEFANEELTTKLEPFVKKINEVEDTSKKKADTVKGMFWWQIEPQKEKDSTLKTLTEAELEEYGAMSEEQLAELDENTLNELNFAGLKNVGSYLGDKAKSAVGGIGTGIKNVAQGAVDAVAGKIEQTAAAWDQMGDEITQQYQKGVKSSVEAKLQKAAQKFGDVVNKLDAASQKAGDGPINKQAVLMSLQGILKGGGGVKEGMNGNDPLNIETQPMMESEEEEVAVDAVVDGSGIEPEAEVAVDAPEGGEEEVFDVTKHKEPELDMTAGFETMGAGIPKPDGAEVTTVEVTKDAVQVTLSESINQMNETLDEISTGLASRAAVKTAATKPQTGPSARSQGGRRGQASTMEQYINPEIKKKINDMGMDVERRGTGVLLVVNGSDAVEVQPDNTQQIRGYGRYDPETKSKVEQAIQIIQQDLAQGGAQQQGVAQGNQQGVAQGNQQGMNESERKVRKYIQNYLQEMAGMKKPSLNEDKKSEAMKKLDKMIESQYALFESVLADSPIGKMLNKK